MSSSNHDFNDVPNSGRAQFQVLDPRFECPVCLSCLKDPLLTQCGHRFCRDCIVEWLEKKGNNCPIDGQRLHRDTDLFPDNCTKREISQQLVNCPYCEDVFPLIDYERHSLDSHETLLNPKPNHSNGMTDLMWSAPAKGTLRPEDTNKSLIKSLYERIVALEQKNLEQELHLKNARDKITELQNERSKFESDLALKICNGNYIWNIVDMRGKIRSMCKDSSNMYYSEGFYTSYTGYKFCARIFVLPQQKYLSLFTHIMKGEYDHTLSWPFSGKISLSLVHPTKSELSLREVMVARPDIEAFKRPLKTFNTRGFGYNEFILLSDLTSHNFFNDDGSLTIKIEINLI